jgi:hypothetical protein
VKRLFWMGVGGALAITAARRARKKLDPVLTAAAPVTGLLGKVRAVRQEIRTAMVAREAELRAAFVEDIADADRPAPGPRRPQPPSWATRLDEDDDEPYSF